MKSLKNPKFIKGMAGDLAKILCEASWDKKGQDITTAIEGYMMVNNLWK